MNFEQMARELYDALFDVGEIPSPRKDRERIVAVLRRVADAENEACIEAVKKVDPFLSKHAAYALGEARSRIAARRKDRK